MQEPLSDPHLAFANEADASGEKHYVAAPKIAPFAQRLAFDTIPNSTCNPDGTNPFILLANVVCYTRTDTYAMFSEHTARKHQVGRGDLHDEEIQDVTCWQVSGLEWASILRPLENSALVDDVDDVVVERD